MQSHALNHCKHVYVHIPFCLGKCHYCGLFSIPYQQDVANAFLESLEREIKIRANSLPPLETLYMGGGTPSLLSTEQWERCYQALHNHIDLSDLKEWSLEAHPATLSDEKVEKWISRGVNRVSLGVQSMCDTTLARIGRPQSCKQVMDAIQTLRKHGCQRFGIDLIACLPGVTLKEWETTLTAAMQLQPEHISVYTLSIEQGSHYASLKQQGTLSTASEDEELHVLSLSREKLSANGYHAYELSNYALAGKACQHNLSVWRGDDYLGLGPSASSRVGRQRWTNTAERMHYIHHPHPSSPRSETLTAMEDASERLLFAFRLSEPVDLDAFAKRHCDTITSNSLLPFWRQQCQQMAEDGLVHQEDHGWVRTEKGMWMADIIAETLIPS